MDGFEIIVVSAETFPRIHRLESEFGLEYGHDYHEKSRDVLYTLATNPSRGRIFLARYAGEDVGFATIILRDSVRFGGRIALIDQIYVQPARRGQGFGRHMLNMVLERIRDFGCVAAEINATLSNRSAINLYGSLGFRARDYTVLALDFIDAEGPVYQAP